MRDFCPAEIDDPTQLSFVPEQIRQTRITMSETLPIRQGRKRLQFPQNVFRGTTLKNLIEIRLVD
jgi:hypothetical protein